MNIAIHTCSNCDNEFSKDYCNNCGQKLAHKITMSHIGHELLHSFTHADKGFLYLFIQLFIRPGKVAREYIAEGKRKRYFLPFQYILIIGTLAAFVAVNSHYFETAITVINGADAETANKARLMHKLTTFLSKYFNFLILLQLPFFTLATFIAYRKYRFNYAEHLTLQTFITAQTTVITMLVMLLIFFIKKSGIYVVPFMSLFSFSFQIFANSQFFKEQHFKGILKALLANILGTIFFIVFMMIAIFLFALFTK